MQLKPCSDLARSIPSDLKVETNYHKTVTNISEQSTKSDISADTHRRINVDKPTKANVLPVMRLAWLLSFTNSPKSEISSSQAGFPSLHWPGPRGVSGSGNHCAFEVAVGSSFD
jgi:hypothetical protein